MAAGSSVISMAEKRNGILPVGAAIKELRKAKRLTAAELAKRRGVQAQAVYTFEGDTRNPRLSTVEGYIEALSVTPTQFVNALAEAIRRRQAMRGILDDVD